MHSSDPTFDQYVIDTKQRGDFSRIIKLINFESNNYPSSELPFLLEVIDADDVEVDEFSNSR